MTEERVVDLVVKVHKDGMQIDLYAVEPGGDVYFIMLSGPVTSQEIVASAQHYRSWKQLSPDDPNYLDTRRRAKQEMMH